MIISIKSNKMTLILKAFVIVLTVACINAQQEAVNSAAEVIDDVEIAPSAGDLSRDKRQLGGKLHMLIFLKFIPITIS